MKCSRTLWYHKRAFHTAKTKKGRLGKEGILGEERTDFEGVAIIKSPPKKY